MSGFEHYDRELAELDNEIRHYATVCGIDLAKRHEIDACLRQHHDGRAADKARESLHGLLILRLKLEAEMLNLGFAPPPLVPPAPGASEY
ncbi:hypothetical protein [Thermomonas sp.]|jgi:hypothetical protein|uniref:hypothetical protein n=1 Tax=Thermomonas sp. TaxID=1971895 RepID=UPI002579B38B|nr:hypothetical protein [Thermomonas sp.]